MKSPLEDLKQQILANFSTLHAFCRENPELKRSTVYQIFSGKYPGKTAKQIEKIQTVLTKGVANKTAPAQVSLTELETYTVLQETKCAYCRKLDKRACPDCRMQTEREAQALVDYVRSREAV